MSGQMRVERVFMTGCAYQNLSDTIQQRPTVKQSCKLFPQLLNNYPQCPRAISHCSIAVYERWWDLMHNLTGLKVNSVFVIINAYYSEGHR